MALRLLYFAWVRERIGRGEDLVTPPESVSTVSDLIDWLAASGLAYREAFADRARLRAAVDDRFVGLDAQIGGARELALFPPVTGG